MKKKIEFGGVEGGGGQRQTAPGLYVEFKIKLINKSDR